MNRRRPRGDEFTYSIIGAFYAVYNEMGYGLLESVYVQALADELRSRGHFVEREVWVDVYYKRRPVARQHIDMLADRSVVLEIKSTPVLPPFARRQLLNYLMVTNLEVGLILHFGPKPAVKRLVSTDKPWSKTDDK